MAESTMALTIVGGVALGAVLGVAGGMVVPCAIYPDSNLCGIFCMVTTPGAAMVGGVTGLILVWRRANIKTVIAVAIGAVVGTVGGMLVPSVLWQKNSIADFMFLVFPVTTMPAGALVAGLIGSLLWPSTKSSS